MHEKLIVLNETSVEQTYVNEVNSTLGRELVFVSSHAIHHFSLLAIITSLQGQTTHALFGVAPSTATYQRAQA